MANKHQKNERNQEKKQPSMPAAQVELSDEQLERVTGGDAILSESPEDPSDIVRKLPGRTN